MSRVPRLRMFAGPKGSGNSTIKSVIRSELLGIYINPDDIEEGFRLQSFLDLGTFGVFATAEKVSSFFHRSELLEKADLRAVTEALRLEGGNLSFHQVEVNSYVASVTANFIRHELLESGTSFTLETVILSLDKVVTTCGK